MTEKEKNQLVAQYEPLINKIVNQFYSTVKCPWNDIRSMANEGFAIAINTYDPKKSSMTFTQFAAYSMRNTILTYLDKELRTIRLSAYAQKKVAEQGGSSFNSISIDSVSNDDDRSLTVREKCVSLGEMEHFSNGDVFEYLYSRIDNAFDKRDQDIFYKTFGLKDYEVTSGKQLAKEFGVSEGLISQRLKRVISYIRGDVELCEMLGSLRDASSYLIKS